MKTNEQIEPAPVATGGAKLAIIGTIEIASGRRDQLLPLLMAHKTRCLTDEPGTLEFEILAPHGNQTKFLLHEVYKDAAAFDLHLKGRSIAQFRQETAGMFTKLEVTKCAIIG